MFHEFQCHTKIIKYQKIIFNKKKKRDKNKSVMGKSNFCLFIFSWWWCCWWRWWCSYVTGNSIKTMYGMAIDYKTHNPPSISFLFIFIYVFSIYFCFTRNPNSNEWKFTFLLFVFSGAMRKLWILLSISISILIAIFFFFIVFWHK